MSLSTGILYPDGVHIINGQSNKDGQDMILGYYGKAGGACRVCLDFPGLGNTIPQGSKIVSATLSVTVRTAATSPDALECYRLDQSFEETQANWSNRTTLGPWSTPGGYFTGDSHDGGYLPTSTGVQATIELAGAIQDCASEGDTDYYVIVKGIGETVFNKYCVFDHPDDLVGAPPNVNISYVPPSKFHGNRGGPVNVIV